MKMTRQKMHIVTNINIENWLSVDKEEGEEGL